LVLARVKGLPSRGHAGNRRADMAAPPLRLDPARKNFQAFDFRQEKDERFLRQEMNRPRASPD
jgi:hypothetical protein